MKNSKDESVGSLVAQIAFNLSVIFAKLALQALAVFLGVAAALFVFGGI